jgi:FtsH-binding integral membrane protein
MRNFFLFYIALVVSIGAELTLMCSHRISRKVPINYILLLIITLGQSYMLSMICALYEPKLVFMVFLIGSVSFFGMSLYAACASYDLTIYGSIIWGLMSCMLTISLLFLFVRGIKILYLIYSALGVIVTLVFVAVDTQMILQNKKYGVSQDDYIKGALILFIDFINLFIYLLNVIGSGGKRR